MGPIGPETLPLGGDMRLSSDKTEGNYTKFQGKVKKKFSHKWASQGTLYPVSELWILY
jgi:hypothetical protein